MEDFCLKNPPWSPTGEFFKLYLDMVIVDPEVQKNPRNILAFNISLCPTLDSLSTLWAISSVVP